MVGDIASHHRHNIILKRGRLSEWHNARSLPICRGTSSINCLIRDESLKVEFGIVLSVGGFQIAHICNRL